MQMHNGDRDAEWPKYSTTQRSTSPIEAIVYELKIAPLITRLYGYVVASACARSEKKQEFDV